MNNSVHDRIDMLELCIDMLELCMALQYIFPLSYFPQMPVYYYPSGQYPTSATQQYRPMASVQYNTQRSPQIPQTAQQAGIFIYYLILQLDLPSYVSG